MNATAPAEMLIRIALVEDDESIRVSLANLFARSSGYQLICSCPDAQTALTCLPQHRPGVVLMDLNLPHMDAIECLRQLKAQMPVTHFIMFTVYADNERLFRSLMAGASGYLLKSTPSAKLLQAIRDVHAGASPMTPQIARRAARFFRDAPPPASHLEGLTPQERDILEQLSQGFLYKEIAANLGLSLDTLRAEICAIYDKLHVRSRPDAGSQGAGLTATER